MAEKASGLKDKIDYQAFFFYVKKKKFCSLSLITK